MQHWRQKKRVGHDLITSVEAAAMCRMSLRTLRKLIKEPGFLTPIWLTPGRMLFRQSDVLALIRRKAEEPTEKDRSTPKREDQ